MEKISSETGTNLNNLNTVKREQAGASKMKGYSFYLLLPFILLLSVGILIVFFLMPYTSAKNSLETLKSTYEQKKTLYNTKLVVLKKVRDQQVEYQNYERIMRAIVPSQVTPLDFTKLIKGWADRNSFYVVNENREVNSKSSSMETEWTSTENSEENPFSSRRSSLGEGDFITFEEELKPLVGTETLETMKIRFNGKTIGQLSAVTFLKNFDKGSAFISKLGGVDYYDDMNEEYIRISFNLETPYKLIPDVVGFDTPLKDITQNEDFIKYMGLYQR